jgi:hypothetical protein
MAKGTGITAPVLGNYASLAEFYLKGQMQILDIKNQVNQIRADELGNLSESIKEISATGISEIDNLHSSIANQSRTQYLTLDDQVRAGEISMAGATAKKNRIKGDVELWTNYTEIAKNRVDEINKGIADGDIIPYSLTRFNRMYFSDPNLNPKYIDGERINDDAMSISLVGDNFNLNKSFQYIDEEGVRQTESRSMPINKIATTNPAYFRPVDMAEITKDFADGLAKQGIGYIDTEGKIQLSDNFRTYTPSPGYQGRVSGPPMAVLGRSIENEIQRRISDDNFIISVLAENYNAGALGDPNKRKALSKEEIQEMFGSMTIQDGQEIPRFYDADGKGLAFTSDPTVLQLDSDGNEVITDEQRALVAADLRDRFLRKIGVTSKDYALRNQDPKKDKPIEAKIQPIRQSRILNQEGQAVPYTIDALLSIDKLEKNVRSLAEYSQSPVTRKEFVDQKVKYQTSPFYYGKAHNPTGFLSEYTGDVLAADIDTYVSDTLTERFTLESARGSKLNNITNIAAVTRNKAKVDGITQPTMGVEIIFIGESTPVKAAQEVEGTIKQKDAGIGADVGVRSQFTVPVYAVATENQVREYWDLIYKELKDTPEMKDFLESKGIDNPRTLKSDDATLDGNFTAVVYQYLQQI